MGRSVFTATLVQRGPGVAVVLDEEQVAAVGEGAKRFPVRRDRQRLHAGARRVVRMGGEFLFGLSKEVRGRGRASRPVTSVEVTLELDRAEREVEVPAALADALAGDVDARRPRSSALAYTHRKEFARWVQEAKREDTRAAPGGQGAGDAPRRRDPQLRVASTPLRPTAEGQSGFDRICPRQPRRSKTPSAAEALRPRSS